MGFVSMNRVQLDQGDGGPIGHFYLDDIDMVLRQRKNGLPVVALEIHNAIIDGENCRILIGVTEVQSNPDGTPGSALPAGRMTEDQYIAAATCPPKNRPGAEPIPVG